ncbi:hypothetical protein C8F04DRAFT_1396780 [Mycena alexandri]|uniref:MYND-type domain-containing protein n=1 Tax=Mycena alexandri TaxID=1745969 RepID=A0AAD6SQF6_9AGAR|nr:hypothetical protein C8F04DRAFT_1396780 [Mycena alexandri]
MNGFSDVEIEALSRLVSTFASGLPHGALPPPNDSTMQMFDLWMQKARSMTTAECKRLADAGDPERMHEFALRADAGLGLAAPDKRRAEEYWTKILTSPRSTPSNIATAHAHLIACTGILFGREGRSIHLSDCMRAGTHAEAAAKAGLGSAPSVLMLGKTLHNFRHGEHKHEFSKWTLFWAAWDARTAERQAELDEENAKRFVRPDRYKCAGPGCPVEASKATMLRACGGKCKEGYKPRYCSKECQVADWKTHKHMCKPGLEPPESDSTLPARSVLQPSVTIERFTLPRGVLMPTLPHAGKTKAKAKRAEEYSVDIDGFKIHSSKDQMSAQEVRELAEEVKILSAATK